MRPTTSSAPSTSRWNRSGINRVAPDRADNRPGDPVVFGLRAGTFLSCWLAPHPGACVRLALTLYLVIATASGPALCCCAGRRVATVAAATAAGHAPAHVCCGKKKPAEGGTKAGGRPTGETPDGPKTPCPCRDVNNPGLAVVTESRGPILPDAGVYVEVVPPAGSYPRFTLVGRFPLTHLSGEAASDRAPHILRC